MDWLYAFVVLAMICNVSHVKGDAPAPYLFKVNISGLDLDMGPYDRIIHDTYNATDQTILLYPSEIIEDEHADANWNVSWVLEYVVNPVLDHYETTKTESFNARKRSISTMFDALPETSAVYHFHTHLTSLLTQLNATYSSFVSLESIGLSVQNRELWVVTLHDAENATVGSFVPLVRLVGNIHGDEAVGREMMLRFAFHLAKQHNVDPVITELLRTTRVQILVSMNPDGFEMGRRHNANGMDMNRGFPDQYISDVVNAMMPREPEVKAVLGLMRSTNCTLSLSAHGGSVVANYPYDATSNTRVFSSPAPCPDDSFFVHVAHVYADAHVRMAASSEFAGGVTNGGAWYQLYGGMQDNSYLWDDSFEITVEMSNHKWPASSTLVGFWQENKPALLAYTQQAHVGVAGFVRVNATGAIVTSEEEVCVDEVPGKTIRTRADGSYIRLLAPGATYTLRVCNSTLSSGAVYVPNPAVGVQPVLVEVDLFI